MAPQNRRNFLAGSAALALTACGGGGGGGGGTGTVTPVDTTPTPTNPNPVQTALTFSNASVHDPSIVRDGSTYYVFGSHLAAAKTTDLMNWTKIADTVNDANPLFTKVTTELSAALTWAQTTTLWAPDVIKLADGKFYMYYCACKGDSPLSALGIAVADKVDGPYANKQLLLKSGMVGPSEDGTNYDATKHPNVVDPAVFFDATGKLWMVYGSYSGGIFILQLDTATGLPIAGQGYGKHLMGGNHARIEGAYVLYSPTSKYYYLFTSFGGLDAVGGYNVRVARSLQPDGPYLDGAGTDMATVKGAAGTVFDDASIASHGVKLMGGHQFSNASFETGTALGYVSPGHNSAYHDPATGKYFIVFHTRFPGTGEAHEIRVHEMLLNEDGWLVIAPLRYAPLSLASPAQTADVTAAQAAGTYKLVNHGKDITAQSKASIAVTLNADGTVGGAGGMTGTWVHNGSNKISVVSGGVTYKGVLSRQWNMNSSAFVVSFSALSSGGVSLWAVRTGS
ncbi:arabinan endo-1,5-alpha-L-arabinosidase [Pelomonas aquatica]|uniref:Arabinan endo-1,5-alpha-L-arabinosidase n=1 Tax=Pelomonas aquatica TaxID=431058 RepID=A0ABU1ZE35_9BURK|nr:glycoside hydrolase family 43 protein [Pelomonas aquatica]MDR7298897.1 arabinan endo-1,5-alpha-L-arabinosidase [Pelomonas aquatica]